MNIHMKTNSDFPVAFIDPSGGIYWCSPLFQPEEQIPLYFECSEHAPLSEDQIDDIAAEHSDEFGHITPDSWNEFAQALIAAYLKQPLKHSNS